MGVYKKNRGCAISKWMFTRMAHVVFAKKMIVNMVSPCSFLMLNHVHGMLVSHFYLFSISNLICSSKHLKYIGLGNFPAQAAKHLGDSVFLTLLLRNVKVSFQVPKTAH